MDFEGIKKQCPEADQLYEDTEFPAELSSVYYSKKYPSIPWRRPKEITGDPKFIVKKATRFDLDQGALGNCWYIAAAATLATRRELLEVVVPLDQTFETGEYAGIFRFRFWRYGTWEEVIVDDRLPCFRIRDGYKLMFCRNREEPNEFWSALLEKAYAKLHGSYEALSGGWTEDAYVDFTGGIGQRIDLTDRWKIPDDLFKTLMHDYKMKSLMACSIHATGDTIEHVLDNGLVIGHAYSITKVAKVDIHGQTEYLIRIRNPWGRKEWNGAWSDGSREWRSVSDAERRALGITNDEDGEFWMSFEEWVKNFEQLQICHLPHGTNMECHLSWKESVFHGSWMKDVSAGGCGNPPYQALYWTNPQYAIILKDPDEDDEDRKCTLIVSLMQKNARALRTERRVEWANVPINFDLYQVKGNDPKILEGENYSRFALKLARRGGKYAYYREITQEFRLNPGVYVIIPATFYVNVEMDFMLRVYTETSADTKVLSDGKKSRSCVLM